MNTHDALDEAWIERIGTREDVCLCANCNTLAACRYCSGNMREVSVSVIRTDAPPYEFDFVVHVREMHSRRCARALNPSPGEWRADLRPSIRDVGPRNRFDPVSARDALRLDTRWWPDRQWLYRAYDETGSLLYVGITGNVASRMRQHERTSDWWPLCDYVELETHPHRRAAVVAERRAIRMELPRFNVAD